MLSEMFPNDLPRHTLAEKAQHVVHWLQSHSSAKQLGQSRIGQLCNVVLRCQNVGKVEPGHPDYELLKLALVEVNELWFIVLLLGPLCDDARFAESFKLMAGDALQPENPRARSPGRDAQWELFCAAIAKRAGFELERPSSGAEYILWSGNTRASIECKRLHSHKKLERRMRDAASQLNSTGIAGWICLDIGLAVEGGGLITPLLQYATDEEVNNAAEKAALHFIKHYLETLVKATVESPAAFVVLRQCVLRPSAVLADGTEQPWSSLGYWQDIPVKLADHPARQSVTAALQLFKHALPNI